MPGPTTTSLSFAILAPSQELDYGEPSKSGLAVKFAAHLGQSQ